ncbi:hypothetical protein [Allokutzneria oryzae]|uniref:Uncharacterized protein n=1 Tax=Allokutzneria oryzae TaxID=1378989 RepID=A0ABV5ZYV2_9PSEU
MASFQEAAPLLVHNDDDLLPLDHTNATLSKNKAKKNQFAPGAQDDPGGDCGDD